MKSVRLTRIKITAAAALAVALLAGCAETVDGSGAQARGASGASSAPASSGTSTSPPSDFPTPDSPSSAESSTPPTDGGNGTESSTTTSCPKPYYGPAQLTFTCITSGMRATSDGIWPLLEVKQVDASGWALQEGAARYTGTETSLESIDLDVRSAMISSGAYLDSPKVTTLRIETGKFGTRRAVVLHSLVTLNPQAAAEKKTKVRAERLWILAVQTSPNVVSLWHTSLPDLVKSLWKKVPATIRTIKVTK